MGYYDVAQVCPNGHVANEATQQYPQSSKTHCEKCGEKTLTACPGCSSPIRGEYQSDSAVFLGASHYRPPAFCHSCGNAFPWTQRAIEAAIELAIESGDLDAQEQEQFRSSVGEIARDTPKAQVASSRLARMLGKMGKGTATAVRDLLVDVASEAAKKAIWPDR